MGLTEHALKPWTSHCFRGEICRTWPC